METDNNTVWRAGDLARKANAAAARAEKRAYFLKVDAIRTALYKMNSLRGSFQVAQTALQTITKQAATIDSDVEKAREKGRQTGIIASNLYHLIFQQAEMPALLADAEQRLREAEADFKAAEEQYDALNNPTGVDVQGGATVPSVPLTEPARGRGRPPKGAQ